MKLSKMALAVALTAGLATGAHAAIQFDPDGPGALGTIDLGAFDWNYTSVLGLGSTAAVLNYIGSGGTCPNNSCTFDALTHATLIGTTNSANQPNTPAGLNSTFEITMVARFTQTVTGVGQLGGNNIVTSQVTSAAGNFLEIYFGSTVNADALEGTGFNDGRLILSATGAGIANGTFSSAITQTPVLLDQFNGDSYNGQTTLTGSGSLDNVTITGISADPLWFQALVASITLQYANISEGNPFISVDPSDCFTPSASGVGIGNNNAGNCAIDHTNVKMDSQAVANGGLRPTIGDPNGGLQAGPDQIFQTDYNSPISGVPEPGTLALLGFGLAAFGLARRGSKKAVQ